MYKQNLHTHSVFCDGKNSLEDIVSEAVARGFDSIGFSSHSYTPFDESYCMKPVNIPQYVSECRRQKEKYDGRIKIYCGIEQDFYAPPPIEKYDFVIGSVHYLKVGGEFVPVDKSAEFTANAVKTHFDGDIYTFAENYYTNVENLKKVTNCDVIGHFDLVTKFSESEKCPIDTSHPRYVAAAEKALMTLLKEDVIFEVNSGAVARAYRSTPYPSRHLLELIAKAKGKITLSSDCHDKTMLDCAYPEMICAARRAGFDEIYVLTDSGFVPTPLT